jgi:pectinesterase
MKKARTWRQFAWLGLLGWLLAITPGRAANTPVVVAQDGSGELKSIQEAINAAPQLTRPAETWVIRIKAGTYREQVYVMREKRFVRLVGDDPEKTIITGRLYAGIPGADGQPIGTFRTPTVWIDADDFSVEGLTIANEAGPVGQALALRVDGDRVSIRRCRLTGWQDTILSNRGRHYFEHCTITGAVDFIFGGGTAYFESCDIVCAGDGFITAASTLPYDEYGFVFDHCRIRGANPAVRTYLGRPWRDFASVLFMNTEMSEAVLPVGWHNWDRADREKTARFAEFNSQGRGAATASRVPWAGTPAAREAQAVTASRVLAGRDHWIPAER